jgi:predicted transcriptional regulator
MKIWRCELYADVLLHYPCVTFHAQADNVEQARALMRDEISKIPVLLQAGEIVEEVECAIHFQAGERLRMTRYVPDEELRLD